ncbi:hypothetical protein CLI73_09965 [Porphyromonas gingivalis]|nr:hypothetical protein CLI73_09965 [Porphyromonas gingivalis]
MVVIQRTTAGLKNKKDPQIRFISRTIQEKKRNLKAKYYLLFLLVLFSRSFVAAQFREKIRFKKSIGL